MSLRQSYARLGKFALIQHQRYAHAKQFKRTNRAVRTLRTCLGRVIRDIGRKIEGNGGLETAFAKLLVLARRVRLTVQTHESQLAGRRSDAILSPKHIRSALFHAADPHCSVRDLLISIGRA